MLPFHCPPGQSIVVDFRQKMEIMKPHGNSGLAPINGAQIYYEAAGSGVPLIMIHAGVADSRQWNDEFAAFAERYQVVRYDLRGFGRSEPVEGEFSHLGDLAALLTHLQLKAPYILMGCSMGGGLAMDYALANPGKVAALVMVDSGPSGLALDVPEPPAFAAAESAYKAGDLDLVAEIETQIWFDGMGRAPDQVDPKMRQLLYEMNRNALAQDAKGLGKRQPDAEHSAAGRLGELTMPVLIIVGDQDIPYMLAAADYMLDRIPSASKMIMSDAAHLPNMDHPAQFQRLVLDFLAEMAPGQSAR